MQAHLDTMLIQNLKINTTIGVYPFEKCITQTLVISLELGLTLDDAIIKDDINKVINYATVVEQIQNFCNNNQFNLIETLALTIIDLLFANFALVQTIDITVIKPGALHNTTVGVKLTRTRR